MRGDDLNSLARGFPFIPFEIHTHSGETFPVGSRDQFVVRAFHLVYQTADAAQEYWIPLRAIAWIRRAVLEVGT